MEYRPLGRTGLSVSEIGFGGSGIGRAHWVGADDSESIRALNRAVELGVNVICTARLYGESERLVGTVVRDHPGTDIHVATMVAPKNMTWPAPDGLHPDEVFPGEHIRASLEESLRVSGLDTFDILQLHVWSDEWVGRGDWLETVQALKDEGKIRFFGVSINDYQPENSLALIESGLVDTVQVIFNVFHQAPRERLFPACLEHNVGVIARVPLDTGGLSGGMAAGATFPEGDFRQGIFTGDRPAQIEDRVAALVEELEIERAQLADTALRYVLSEPAVSTVIPGMRSVRNVQRNTAVSDGKSLTDNQLAVLARHRWERNFYVPA